MGVMYLVRGIASLAAFVILVSLLSRYRLGRIPTLAFTFFPYAFLGMISILYIRRQSLWLDLKLLALSF